MFSIGPILLEIFFVLIKPQELYPWLQSIKPLYTLPALIILGLIFDLGRFGAAKLIEAPQFRVAIVVFAWAMTTVLIKQADAAVPEAVNFGTAFIVGMSIAHSVRSIKQFQIFAGAILAIACFLAFIGDHQAFAPKGCIVLDAIDQANRKPDGRRCGEVTDCTDEGTGADPEKEYACEHVGLMGTVSVNQRIRFRGNLEDPNELSLATAIALPWAIAFFQKKKSFLSILTIIVAFGLIGTCVVKSQSRGGQLVFMVVLGTYFLRRFGLVKGLVAAAVIALPVLAMGGRGGEEADESAMERIDAMQTGIYMVKANPILGVGKGQFGQYHYLNAHNSYVLAAAETGIVGLTAWATLILLSIKVPLTALIELKDRTDAAAEEARIWAGATLASLAGMTVGIFFLSFTFHTITWTYVGMSGALAGALRPVLPAWRVKPTRKEIIFLFVGGVALMFILFYYTKRKLG